MATKKSFVRLSPYFVVGVVLFEALMIVDRSVVDFKHLFTSVTYGHRKMNFIIKFPMQWYACLPRPPTHPPTQHDAAITSLILVTAVNYVRKILVKLSPDPLVPMI